MSRCRLPTSQAAKDRVDAWIVSPHASQCALTQAAVDGALDIIDDFYESCRTVLLFEKWKCQRAELWDDWLKQQRYHMMVFHALHDRQAFAGQAYFDGAADLLSKVKLQKRWRERTAKEKSVMWSTLSDPKRRRPAHILVGYDLKSEEALLRRSAKEQHTQLSTSTSPPVNSSSDPVDHSIRNHEQSDASSTITGQPPQREENHYKSSSSTGQLNVERSNPRRGARGGSAAIVFNRVLNRITQLQQADSSVITVVAPEAVV